MPSGEHIHIISAGDRIHIAYPIAFRTLPSITRTCVIADEEVYAGISKIPEIERPRQAIRSAVSAVKEISASLAIPFSYQVARHPLYPSVRTILTRLHRENPGARFTFDITGGSKELCLALMSLAPWVGGEVFSAFDEKVPRDVTQPERSIRSMMENVNYQTILAVMLRKNKAGKGIPELPWVTRSYLFSQVWPYYIRSRKRKPKTDNPVIQYRNGRKPAQNLSQATFSSFITILKTGGFINEKHHEKNRKEKAYRITELGETAFRIYADPATNSAVKMILESTQSGPGF